MDYEKFKASKDVHDGAWLARDCSNDRLNTRQFLPCCAMCAMSSSSDVNVAALCIDLARQLPQPQCDMGKRVRNLDHYF